MPRKKLDKRAEGQKRRRERERAFALEVTQARKRSKSATARKAVDTVLSKPSKATRDAFYLVPEEVVHSIQEMLNTLRRI
jgi:hypothetical protein